jgi:hypothetical protein
VVGAFGHNRTVARVVCTERFRVSAAWAIASAYCALRVCTELSSHPHPHSPLLWPPASCASPAASIATALRDARALLEAEGNAGGASALRSVAEEFVLSTLSK